MLLDNTFAEVICDTETSFWIPTDKLNGQTHNNNIDLVEFHV